MDVLEIFSPFFFYLSIKSQLPRESHHYQSLGTHYNVTLRRQPCQKNYWCLCVFVFSSFAFNKYRKNEKRMLAAHVKTSFSFFISLGRFQVLILQLEILLR